MSQRTPKRPLEGDRSRPRGSRATNRPVGRVSRAQRESQYQRMLYIGLAAAAAIIVLSLLAGALYEYRIKPNQVLATVNGDEITREDYWSYQSVTLYNQARMYEDYALQVTGQQQTQFLQYAAQLDRAREDVWGSTDVSDATISQMIEDRLYVNAAENQGVDMSDPVLQQFALNTFAPSTTPLITPVPSPTMIPERAAWATETAEAMATEQAIAMGTPVGQATPIASPAASPEASPAATPTPDVESARFTAQAAYDLFRDEAMEDARMDEETYLQTIIKPQVARTAIDAEIAHSVPQTAPQVEVQHILVATHDLANQTFSEVEGGADFGEIAETRSIDTITAPTGGHLGWVTQGELPDAVSDLAFATDVDSIAGPVESPYGWHVIKVLAREDDRPLTTRQYDDATANARTTWLEEQRTANDVESDHYQPTPEPTTETFLPPADAPTPIVATPVAAPDLSATPIAGPQLAPQATPSASPASTPVIAPEATPAN